MDGRKHGGYQTHFPVPELETVVKLPDNISPDIGCMLPCSALTTYNAMTAAKGSIEFGIKSRGQANMLIIGSGGLGCWSVINARAMHGDKINIFCADLSQEKLDLTKDLGANETILIQKGDSVEQTVALITEENGTKMDAVLDCVGATHTQNVGFFSLHNGGTLVSVGLAGGKLEIPIPTLIGRSISIKGNRVGDIVQLKEVTKMFSQKGFHKLPPTEYFHLDQANEVLDKLRNGQIAGRAVFKFE